MGANKRFGSYRIILQTIIIALLVLFIHESVGASSPICVFIDDDIDYSVVFGKPKQATTAFKQENGLAGPADMVTIGVLHNKDEYEVFAYNSKEYPQVLYRYLTTDFVHYSAAKTVMRLPDNRQWLGFRALTKRPDKSEYLLMAAEKIEKEKAGFTNGIHFFKSYDGINWNPLNNGNAAYHDHDMGGIIWYPKACRYVVWQITYQPYETNMPLECKDHMGNMRRVVSVRKSTDGTEWEPSLDIRKKEPLKLNPEVFMPDSNDSPDAQFYGVQLFPYADRFLAAVQIYAPSPQPVNPNNDLSWEKRNRTSPKHGPQGLLEVWIVGDPTNMSTWKRPFRENDFTGDTIMNRLRHEPILFEGKYIEIQSHTAFSIPLHRIIGLNSKLNSIIDTRSFIVPASALSLNASASWHPEKHPDYQRSAYIMAEVHSSKTSLVIPGYEKEKCIIVDKDSPNIMLKWGNRTTAELCGQEVFLRLYFRDATIFSLQESQ